MNSSNFSAIDRLEKLADMYKSGALEENEFNLLKKQLLEADLSEVTSHPRMDNQDGRAVSVESIYPSDVYPGLPKEMGTIRVIARSWAASDHVMNLPWTKPRINNWKSICQKYGSDDDFPNLELPTSIKGDATPRELIKKPVESRIKVGIICNAAAGPMAQFLTGNQVADCKLQRAGDNLSIDQLYHQIRWQYIYQWHFRSGLQPLSAKAIDKLWSLACLKGVSINRGTAFISPDNLKQFENLWTSYGWVDAARHEDSSLNWFNRPLTTLEDRSSKF